MTDEQKQNMQDANAAVAVTALVTLSEAQLKALKELGIYDDKEQIAQAAFDSSVRGKLQSSIDRAIKAKYLAEGKGKKALASECEVEIQAGLKLKREL
jgi:hypothetical protein